jgi:hypothetical protein
MSLSRHIWGSLLLRRKLKRLDRRCLRYINFYLLSQILLTFYYAQSSTIDNIFDEPPLPTTQSATLSDKLEHYLSSPVEDAPNPLKWWKSCEKQYPCLSRMALDYLSIPGMYYLNSNLLFTN